MKLQQISIDQLFGVFDHVVKLNDNSQITIVIGENGLGKTVLLEIIDAFFKGNFQYFSSVEFNLITFTFDDRIVWEIRKNNQENSRLCIEVTQINRNGSKYKPYYINTYDEREIEFIIHKVNRENPYLRRTGPQTWEDRRTGERINSRDIINSKYYSNQIKLFNEDDVTPKWFSERHDNIEISLIETQRLISLEDTEEKTNRKTVEKYSKELSQTIKSFLTASTELSSKLDRTYPNRLINRLKDPKDITNDFLINEFNRLEKKRELLDTVGLIEIDKDSSILEIGNPQDVLKDVLMLYIEDSFKKIEIFDLLASKIELLIDIINRRFKHKKLYIDKEEGFIFRSSILKSKDTQAKIPVHKLSSGEQNELVLFYLLLFKTKENSLILIDEPEVSLHISWQNCFIDDLKQINKLNNLSVLIATHSPDIISNNWDLKVELKGKE